MANRKSNIPIIKKRFEYALQFSGYNKSTLAKEMTARKMLGARSQRMLQLGINEMGELSRETIKAAAQLMDVSFYYLTGNPYGIEFLFSDLVNESDRNYYLSQKRVDPEGCLILEYSDPDEMEKEYNQSTDTEMNFVKFIYSFGKSGIYCKEEDKRVFLTEKEMQPYLSEIYNQIREMITDYMQPVLLEKIRKEE